ncbi:MAG: TIGR02556 family CRISPR-associated protein [Methanothrix sp.]|uniref:TIGR02556 family CRISPR-associated protein n=1 Tax=Methanothrix sp. TaxID=90426 RepID=UPI001B674497|nr:TIGR02556 family CRISPR-associated protein [Methanothrix sp.]MBP7067745.1 TIGR02556 family CRISPR-associated protein [Methanothrix sp.]
MIEAVRRIGDYVLQKNGSCEDSLATFMENPNSNGKYKVVLIVVLRETNGDYSFSRVVRDEFIQQNLYLYKKGAPNGTDATPTSMVAGDIKRTFDRFMEWFENYDDYKISDDEQDIIRKMSIALTDQRERIFEDLSNNYSQREPKTNAIITLGFENGDSYSYINENPIFEKILLLTGRNKYFQKKSQGTSLGLNSICFLCNQRKPEVYGFAIPWTFHTYDNRTNLAGGFEIPESWKNTPICFDCATRLELGKKIVEDKLNFEFYGFNYLMIPKMAMGGDPREILRILTHNDQKRDQKISQEVRKRLTSDEKEILKFVAEQSDFISTNLIFYKKVKSQYNILLSIDGIVPSRLRKIFDVKKRVDKRFRVYNEEVLNESQKETEPLEFNFKVVRTFFPSSAMMKKFEIMPKNGNFDKIFMDIVNKIFVGNSIDYHLLIRYIILRIRDIFDANHSTNVVTLNGFLLLCYLNELEILKNFESEVKDMDKLGEEELSMEHLEGLPLEQKIDYFFHLNEKFFTSNAKKATFLEGVLAQFLLNNQLQKRGATPFRDKLHGLRMNKDLIKKLLPEIQNKLEEYKRNYYRELEEIIARYFILSGENWEESNDELSFYFVLGMNSHKLFKDAIDKEEI